jgi:DNA-directed RNA polymerase subunit RPC12/RpoP
MPLTPELRRAGVTPELMNTTRRFACPNCGKEFSLMQSRAIACRGCRMANTNCRYARCPYCDKEFPMEQVITKNKYGEKYLAGYANNILNNYYTQFGKRNSR